MDSPLNRVLFRLLQQPTAPFHEGQVAAVIRAELEGCPHVRLTEDPSGNLVAEYRRGPGPARWAFAAHMDHPAYVRDPDSGKPVFLGGVPEKYRVSNPPVRDFGPFAMWDLPECEVHEGRVYSRACDDLVGCAVIVRLLQELEETGSEAHVYGLFTRAEEVGFVGAVKLAQTGIVPTSAAVISLETSSERGGLCRMGDGVIVRVGDRTSVFDPGVTEFLGYCARQSEIPFQRALMSGGTCEASAYRVYGYITGALCVALGNYHNCGEADRIAPEFVDLGDVQSMSRLCFRVAVTEPAGQSMAEFKSRIEKAVEEHARFLK
jgi:endoglucanase